jgi:hypothetical protein
MVLADDARMIFRQHVSSLYVPNFDCSLCQSGTWASFDCSHQASD